MLEFKTSFMGLLSVQSKLEKRAQDEVVSSTISAQAPLAGAVLSAFPGVRKLIMKNPALVDWLLTKVATVGKGDGHVPVEVGSEDFAARLEKYA